MSDNRDNRDSGNQGNKPRRSGRIEQAQREGAPNYNPNRAYNRQGGQSSQGGQRQGNNPQQRGQPSGSNQQRGQPSGSGQVQGNNLQRGGFDGDNRPGSNNSSRPGSNAGSRPGSDAGSRRGSDAGSWLGFDDGSRPGSDNGSRRNSPRPGPARLVSQEPGDQPLSNVYQQRGGSHQRSISSGSSASGGFEVLNQAPPVFQRNQPPSGNIQGARPSGSNQQGVGRASGGPRAPTMVARGGPGRSVGGYAPRTPERDVPRRESTPLSDSDQYCEIDSDLEITGSQESVRPRRPQVPPQAIPFKGYPSRGSRSGSSASGSGRGQSQPPRGKQRSTAQVEMQKLAASGARLKHDTAVHNMTMHILRTEQREIFQNATLQELQNGPQYAQVRARVMRGIAEGTIDQATLARFGGDPPAGGGSMLGRGNNRRGGGAGGGAGGIVGV